MTKKTVLLDFFFSFVFLCLGCVTRIKSPAWAKILFCHPHSQCKVVFISPACSTIWNCGLTIHPTLYVAAATHASPRHITALSPGFEIISRKFVLKFLPSWSYKNSFKPIIVVEIYSFEVADIHTMPLYSILMFCTGKQRNIILQQCS